MSSKSGDAHVAGATIGQIALSLIQAKRPAVVTPLGINTPVRCVLIIAADTANAAMLVNFHMEFLSAGCTLQGIELKLVKMEKIAREKFVFLLIHPVNSEFCYCHPLLLLHLKTTKIVVLFVIAVQILHLLHHPLRFC
jgi:hypothetical protein